MVGAARVHTEKIPMHVHLLCPGPSLASYVPQPCDLTIGVNRAACAVMCNVWVACDTPLIVRENAKVLGLPLLVSTDTTLETIPDHGVAPWAGGTFDSKQMLEYCPHAYQWVTFSATTALIFAAFRGARVIEVFGADWSGTQDYDGVEAGQNRQPDRWQLEREIWNNLVAWLAEPARGVIVRRHLPRAMNLSCACPIGNNYAGPTHDETCPLYFAPATDTPLASAVAANVAVEAVRQTKPRKGRSAS